MILFENGEEVLRFPPIDDKGKVGKVLRYDKKELEKYFELEQRFLMSETRTPFAESKKTK